LRGFLNFAKDEYFTTHNSLEELLTRAYPVKIAILIL